MSVMYQNWPADNFFLLCFCFLLTVDFSLKPFSALFFPLQAAVLIVYFSILYNTCKTLKSWAQAVLVLLPHKWAALFSRSALPKGWPLLHSSIYYPHVPWQGRNSMNSNSGVWDDALSPALLWSSCLLILFDPLVLIMFSKWGHICSDCRHLEVQDISGCTKHISSPDLSPQHLLVPGRFLVGSQLQDF